ncbi:MAG: hypothetical protein LiPW39_297 [Parcubacteria group bacterium LiPW_39]|nr:MAG: hypothetical protein LiPW39_297 [Parcubacteria group bacterium LiPW_39]
MPKSLAFILVSTLLITLKAPNFAYSAVLAQESSPMPSPSENWLEMPLPAGPLDPWLEKLKGGAQDLMNQAQKELQQGAGKASESAQQAVKDEISRQASQASQEAKKGISAAVERVVTQIKSKIGEIISNIKIFFQELYWKFTTKTY